jgi:cell division septum initiation protein DivIVA
LRSSARLAAVPSPPAVEPVDRRRPTLSGDLRTLFQHAPVFRRRPGGYDRFQVDTYVRWAEEELAAAAHERDEILLRYARLRADLDEARRLLCHPPAGRESLQLSVRLGSVLAAAADQADGIRADAEAVLAAARTESERMLSEAAAEAARIVAEATAEADRRVAEADGMVAEADRLVAEANDTVAEAERVMAEARTEAEARLAKVWEIERLAGERTDRLRQEAARDAETARLQARDEVLRTLAAAREERRRWEERRALLQAELVALEQRLADDRPVAVPVPRELRPVEAVAAGRRAVHLPHLGRFRR